MLAGAILSGAIFGDNVAPISDTTIASASSQAYTRNKGCADIGGVVASRTKYALVAGAFAVVCFALFGGSGSTSEQAAELLSQYSDPKGLIMLTSICLGSANGPAIIMFGPIADEIGKSKGLHPYRRANLLDGFASTLPVIIPVTSSFIFIAVSCVESAAAEYDFISVISPVSIAISTLHCIFLFVVFCVAVFTGWGRRYEGLDGRPVKKEAAAIEEKYV